MQFQPRQHPEAQRQHSAPIHTAAVSHDDRREYWERTTCAWNERSLPSTGRRSAPRHVSPRHRQHTTLVTTGWQFPCISPWARCHASDFTIWAPAAYIAGTGSDIRDARKYEPILHTVPSGNNSYANLSTATPTANCPRQSTIIRTARCAHPRITRSGDCPASPAAPGRARTPCGAAFSTRKPCSANPTATASAIRTDHSRRAAATDGKLGRSRPTAIG
jgi:hypothetical protein